MSTTKNGPAISGLQMEEGLIFERSRPGRTGYSLPALDVPSVDAASLFGEQSRKELEGFPEVSEMDVMRHFVRLSQWNYGVDTGFFPLGSCTMKYNPKLNEDMARLCGFTATHPSMPDHLIQGNLELMDYLERALAELSGMDAVTLQPAAGAHGELTGVMVMRAYHEAKGNKKTKMLVPDSAHGTNPATAAFCGYKAVEVKSGPDGFLLPEDVAKAMDDEVAGIMITNPNTLGIFEQHIEEIAHIVHEKDGLLYCDGANFNAMMGVTRPGDMGYDVIHFNLHKSFSTPHGGGGPGSGPVGVKKSLEAFLPGPRIRKDGDTFRLDEDLPQSIGKIKGFFGNFGVLVRAYAYLREIGKDHVANVARYAVLNANYIRSRLVGHYHLPFETPSMHEVVFTDKLQKANGVETMDLAKSLIDEGYHPPTTYFPLVVSGALMIEPTETESLETLDQFCDSMIALAERAKENPDVMHDAPTVPVRRRLDETLAARKPILRYQPEE